MSVIPGYPRLLHGGDYNPDQWLDQPEIIAEDFRLMELAGCHTFSVGIFGWTAYEKTEGVYTFDWLDAIMDRMAAKGFKVILATPSGSKPAWMSRRHPEIRRVNRQGLREPHQGRHNHCWSSPVFREKVTAINSRLAERYHGHPALGMWHLSNEYSGECFCERCLGRWHEWLKSRYTTLDGLNRAWWTAFWSHTFTDWAEIDPRDGSLDGLALDWHRFLNWQVADFIEVEKAPLKRLSPEVPCAINTMGLFNGLDYARLSACVDLIGDDQYPSYDADGPGLHRHAASISFKQDLYRCMQPGRPFFIMESSPDLQQWKKPNRLKRPGLHRAETLQAIGHGADGMCYFQWRKGRGGMEKFHGAVVDHVGHEHTRVFQGVAEVGRLLDRLAPVAGAKIQAKVALVYDWEARWGFQTSDGPCTDGELYNQLVLDHYRPFWDRGIPVDVVNMDCGDLSNFQLLITPALWMLKPRYAARLRTFVENGGTLVGTFFTGICDPTNLCFLGGWPGNGLGEVFGVWNEETDCQNPGVTRPVRIEPAAGVYPKSEYTAERFFGLVHLRGAEALATYGADFFAGMPAVTSHSLGRGRAFYLAARMDDAFLASFYARLAGDLGLEGCLAEKPAGVAAQRRDGPDASWLFAQNFTPRPQTLRFHETGWTRVDAEAAPAGECVTLPPFGSEVWTRPRD
ncbi:MAG: beta-galactosidase [Puniceicoccaceae bacterium]|nr:MAG: beta-galactosidase [Puniceicoccaceae bacterium]